MAKIETPSGEKSVKEVKADIQKFEQLQARFAAAKEALQLIDLTRTENRSFSTYNKDTLRTYLKNPFQYQTQLRQLSKFLYRLCYPYRRLIWSRARMFDFNAYTVTPLVTDPSSMPTPEEQLQKFYDTAVKMQRMDLASEMFKLLVTAWREDTVYAYVYDDTENEGGTLFFHILDGDYCKVSSIENGVLRFAMDFSYWRSHTAELEYVDKEFQQKYNKYLADNNLRWQELEPNRQICLKVNVDDPTMDYPPLAQLFPAIISLLDIQELQDVKDELEAYKLLVMRLETRNGATDPDDFEVDIQTAISYYNRLVKELPDCVSAILSPVPIDTIEFNRSNTTQDTDMISNAMSNLFQSAGGSQILDSDKSGSDLFRAQIITEVGMAQASLLPQIQRWTALYLNYALGEDHAFVRFIDGVCDLTRADKREELLKSAQFGLPNKMKLAAIDGTPPLEVMSAQYFENEVLELHKNWVPLMNSYVQSGAVAEGTDPVDGGAPKKDSGDLSDEGDKSRNK